MTQVDSIAESLAAIDERERLVAAEFTKVSAVLGTRQIALDDIEHDMRALARKAEHGSHDDVYRALAGKRSDLQLLIERGGAAQVELKAELQELEEQRRIISHNAQREKSEAAWMEAKARLVGAAADVDESMRAAVASLAKAIDAHAAVQAIAKANNRAVPSRWAWSLPLCMHFTADPTVLRTLGVSCEISIAKAAASGRLSYSDLARPFADAVDEEEQEMAV